MTQKTALFEITLNDTLFSVAPGFSGLNVYRLYSNNGNYVIAKDFYNIWVELNRSPGAPNMPVNQAGRKIEECLKATYTVA